MAVEQNAALRVVAGAYKATPIRNLEVETMVPPLDLYLNKRKADFEAKLQATRKIKLIEEARLRIARAWERHKRRKCRRFTLQQATQAFEPTRSDREAETTAAWAAQGANSEEALWQSWKLRLAKQALKPETNLTDRKTAEIFSADKPWTETKKKLEKHFGKHESLTKAQSSLLVQARTGKIGLKRFLFQRKVPEIPTPLCRCGQAEKTVWHVLSGCTSSDAADAWLDFESPAKLMKKLKEKEKVGPILGCLAKRLAKYRLAEKLENI